MPLKINVGLSQKVGLPDYGSLGATCHVEYEADSRLLLQDPSEFQRQVQQAYLACQHAVQNELSRHQTGGGGHPSSVNVNSTGTASTANGQQRVSRKATSSQVRAIHTIADRLQVDLTNWLQQKFGLHATNQLSIAQASTAIDELKALPAGASGGVY